MAFVSSVGGFANANTRSVCSVRPRVGRVQMTVTEDDKAVVKEYFNTKGFERWNRIYSEDGEVNNVQMDIRTGHQVTIDTILEWLDQDGNLAAKKICDAGCGVGSLALPLGMRGATVFASDISDAMVQEGRRRAEEILGSDASKVNFETSDLEALTGSYDVVCCVDVLIHYPDEKLREMIGHLCSLTTDKLIFSFAPKTFFLGILKKVGEFFPGPSKATRAYLHSEDEVVSILSELGFKVTRRASTDAKFYFSTILEDCKA